MDPEPSLISRSRERVRADRADEAVCPSRRFTREIFGCELGEGVEREEREQRPHVREQ